MFENIGLSFQGIWNHKLRSLLTMLGIIIGIASIIAIVSTIKGTNEQIKQQLIGAGNNVVKVQLCQGGYQINLQYNSIPDGVGVLSEDTRAQLEELDGVLDVSLYRERTYVENVYRRTAPLTARCVALTAITLMSTAITSILAGDLPRAITRTTARWRSWTRRRRRASSGGKSAGQILEIYQEPFTVVGVVAQRSTYEPQINSYEEYSLYVGSQSGAVYLPDTLWPIVCQYDEPQTVDIQARSTDDMTSVGREAEEIINATLSVSDESDISYASTDVLEQAQQLQQLANATNQQLIWIASISLLVAASA